MVSFPQESPQNPFSTSPVPHTWHLPHPSHYSWFDNLNDIWLEVRSIKLLLCSLLYSPVILSLLGLNIFLSILFPNTLSLWSSLSLRDQASHPTILQAKLQVCIFWSLYFWISYWKTKDFASLIASIPWLQPALNFFMNGIWFVVVRKLLLGCLVLP